MDLSTLTYLTRCRIVNRWRDLSAFLAGYCNDAPWRPDPGGGYVHWRCALRRGHDGMHRARNYVWTPDGRTDYLPVPPGQPMPNQPRDRHHVPTRRQTRARRRWDTAQRAAILTRTQERDGQG